MTSTATIEPTAKAPRAAGDTLATVLLTVGLFVVMWFSLILTGLYAMATDPCSQYTPCDFGALTTAYVWSLGTLALGPVIGLIGAVRAYRRGLPLFPWPLVALAIVLLGGAVGLHFTTLITP